MRKCRKLEFTCLSLQSVTQAFQFAGKRERSPQGTGWNGLRHIKAAKPKAKKGRERLAQNDTEVR